MNNTGQGDLVAAEKVSDSGCEAGLRTRFTYGWQVPIVGFDTTWEVWKRSPEEPASRINGMEISDEPAGRRMFKNGILEWRKVTRAMVASCSEKAVTYKGSWMGYISGKLVVISVENASSKAIGQSWIEGYIDKVVAAALEAPAKQRTPAFVGPYIPAGFAVDDQRSVTQYLGPYNVTRVAAQRPNRLPKPFVSPENSELDLVYTEVMDPSFAPLKWQQAQQEAEKESQAEADSGRTFIGKETTASGGTIYWYRENPLRYLPRRLRAKVASGEPSLSIYDATITQKLGKGSLTVKITDFVGEREALRQSFMR